MYEDLSSDGSDPDYGGDSDSGGGGVTSPDNALIRWRDYDGRIIKTEEIKKGTNAIPPESPTREGCDFIKWDLGPYYKVTFKDYNGTTLKEEYVKLGMNSIPPTTPNRDGYKFAGWDSEKYNVVRANVVITAKYTEKPKYTIEWKDPMTREILRTDTVTEGDNITSLPPLDKYIPDYGYVYEWSCTEKDLTYILGDKTFYFYQYISNDLLIVRQSSFRTYSVGDTGHPVEIACGSIRPRSDLFTNYSWISVMKDKKCLDANDSKLTFSVEDGSIAAVTVNHKQLRIEAFRTGTTYLNIAYNGETLKTPLVVTDSKLNMCVKRELYSDYSYTFFDGRFDIHRDSTGIYVPTMDKYQLQVVCNDYNNSGECIDYRIPVMNYYRKEDGSYVLKAERYYGMYDKEYGIAHEGELSSSSPVFDNHLNFHVDEKVLVDGKDITIGSGIKYGDANLSADVICTVWDKEMAPVYALDFIRPYEGSVKVTATFSGIPMELRIYYKKQEYFNGYSHPYKPGLVQTKELALTISSNNDTGVIVPFDVTLYREGSIDYKTLYKLNYKTDHLVTDGTELSATTVGTGKLTYRFYYVIPKINEAGISICNEVTLDENHLISTAVLISKNAVPGTYIYTIGVKYESVTSTLAETGETREIINTVDSSIDTYASGGIGIRTAVPDIYYYIKLTVTP